MSAPGSILVYVGLDLMGDGLIKLPFLKALRDLHPTARITWLAGKGKSVYAGALAPLVAPFLDEVIDDAHIGGRWSELLGRPLPGRSFDLIIDTQRRVLTTLIVRRVRHRRFISGAARFLLSDARPAAGKKKAPSMLRQMIDLLELAAARPVATPGRLDLPLPEAAQAQARALLPDGARHVGLAPGAGGRHKRWPAERFIDAARALSAAGLVPVFLLGPDEAAERDAFAAALPAARFPLQEAASADPLLTIALGRRLAAAVANDSGAGHMLAASGAPLVSLFGPTDPAKFAPTADRLTLIRAQDWGQAEMAAIPVAPVVAAVLKSVTIAQNQPHPTGHEA